MRSRKIAFAVFIGKRIDDRNEISMLIVFPGKIENRSSQVFVDKNFLMLDK